MIDHARAVSSLKNSARRDPGPPAPVLYPDRRRLPDQQDPPGALRVLPSGLDPRSAVLKAGFDRLPEPAHLSRLPAARKGDGRLSLRPQADGFLCSVAPRPPPPTPIVLDARQEAQDLRPARNGGVAEISRPVAFRSSPGALRPRLSRLGPGREQARRGAPAPRSTAYPRSLRSARRAGRRRLPDRATSRGRTGRYLELQRRGELDLLRMVRDGLVHGLESAREPASKKPTSERRAAYSILKARIGPSPRRDPIGSGAEQRFLVLFEEPVRPARGERQKARADRPDRAGTAAHLERSSPRTVNTPGDHRGPRGERTRSCSRRTRSPLQQRGAAVDQRRAGHGAGRAAVDQRGAQHAERGAANRNDELSQVNGDLVNLLASVNIAIVMVGEDCKVRRFTPAAESS